MGKHASHLSQLVIETIEGLNNVHFPFEVPGVYELRASKDALTTQLSARILPHLVKEAVPALVVFGGSSGAGKSTIVNSIIGEEITEASVLRPTTRTPVLVYHPDDELSMKDHAITEIARVKVTGNAMAGTAIIDAPDLDSVDDLNRELSATLQNASDLWVFVTTASRYGDHVAWSALTEAYASGMTVGVILNRVPARAKTAVRKDLLERMDAAGMGEAPLFIIDDAGPTDGMLDKDKVSELRQWLELVSSTHAAKALSSRTTRALMPQIRSELLAIADGASMQADAAQELIDAARGAGEGPVRSLGETIDAGRLGAGAPTTRWLTLASTGGVLAPVVSGKKLFVSKKTMKRDSATKEIASAVESALRVALTQALVDTKNNARHAWEESWVETDNLVVSISIDRAIERAVSNWVEDSKAAAERMNDPIAEKFSTDGLAALLRAAAGGVAGAKKLVDGTGGLTRTQRALRDRSIAAVQEVVGQFTEQIEAISIPDPSRLRIRAQELVNSVWEK